MKQIFLIFSILLPFFVVANESSSNVEKGDSSYLAGDYTAALNHYLFALKTEGSSSELYFNIGNAYFRTGNPAKAILNYERALRVDPTNSDARTNLEFVNSKIVDKTGDFYTGLHSVARAFNQMLTSNGWAYLAFALFILTIVCAILYFFSEKILLRKFGFFGGITFVLLFIVAIAESFYSKSISTSKDEAIIISKSVILSTSPRVPDNSTEEALLLHEGTKLYILDSVTIESDSVKTVWFDVMPDSERRAWISTNAVEKI